jgi:lipoprotein-anchoring transpeptidase ErfK/SrfK
MKPSHLATAVWLAAATASSGVAAQPMAAASQPGAYGGGFIEMLMTGGGGAATARPMPASAALGNGILYASPGRSYGAPQGYQVASLPGGAESDAGLGIERAADPRYARQVVSYDGPHRPGTIVIDTPSKYLYLVQPGGQAVRYGIGVGRPGFTWAGVKTVSQKRTWPDWTPPSQMLLRRPDLPRHMEGGPGNPLGARALYLGSSLYRIHGTNEPWTIGQNVSSGCIRMMNEDVVDLYGRVAVGTKVIVL